LLLFSGKLINADVNASLNIERKVIANFMEGIEKLPFVFVVVDPLGNRHYIAQNKRYSRLLQAI
jgi:transposase